MPFYKFIIQLQDNSLHGGIRELLDEPDINAVWRKYEAIAKAKYGQGQFKSFRCIMLSKLDPEVREFLSARGKTSTDWNVEFEPTGIKPVKPRDKSKSGNWRKGLEK